MSEDCPHCLYDKTHKNCPGCWEGSHYRPKPFTNGDRVRSMTDEEIVELLAKNFCDTVCGKDVCDGQCFENILKWLKQECDT